MDLERDVRAKLIGLLEEEFDCFQEVTLRTPKGNQVRCDVLAIPHDSAFAEYPLAFECKRPSQNWHYASWARAIKQAADNVDAEVIDTRISEKSKIAASFLFPAPMVVPSEKALSEHALIRPGFENAVAGMFHLALMFRVGKSGTSQINATQRFSLTLGPNEVWNDQVGFTKNGRQLLLGGRPIGSRNKPQS